MIDSRLKSIDILRAVTMLLMIFVNDLWTLSGVPDWLGHKAAHEDGMGLADVVFPAFLFIVGLSIPHAIQSRLKKGDSKILVCRHILERTLALWIMGVFMVNLENIDPERILFGKLVWQILMTLGFFLIWNQYQGKVFGRIPHYVPKIAGWLLLIFLAIIYKASPDTGHQWMRLHWWGILGLIGWGYLLGAGLYLLTGNRPLWLAAFLLILMILNVNEFQTPFGFRIRLVVSASNYASVMAGVLVTSVMIRLREKDSIGRVIPFLLLFAVVLLTFGFLTRPFWGISKIMATPSWTAICAAITSVSFAVLYLVADRMHATRWASVIEPAGSSTLTCYLIPYYLYAIGGLSRLSLPAAMTSGAAGIMKSILFSILVIQLTGFLVRYRIKLKI
jgi:predicted acyltransferase